MTTPTLDDLWLVIRAIHRDLGDVNERIRKLEAELIPLVRDDEENVVLRLADEIDVVEAADAADDADGVDAAEPPGWISPSAATARRSHRVWRSASGS